ncbi:MAG: hypothetical protein ACOYUZ_03500 [Patescibacteria group bacterium]
MYRNRREFEELRKAIKLKGLPEYAQIQLELLEIALRKLAAMAVDHPDETRTLVDIQKYSTNVLQAVRASNVRGLRIPDALHTFRKTSLYQPLLVRHLALEIAT